MDSKELHYLSYDPDAIWQEMMLAYVEAGGEVLYPGDEKEMLLRGVLQMFVQAFAGIDNALRMDTLRYATGEYLDIYGEKRNCERIQALKATCAVKITFKVTGEAKVLPAGTVITDDNGMTWITSNDISVTGQSQTTNVTLTCGTEGAAGNGLRAGTNLQTLLPEPSIETILTLADASGGQNRETDENYRDRIRRYGLNEVTTGPAKQYEQAAMAVNSGILDANTIAGDNDGDVDIYLLLEDPSQSAAIIAAVTAALSAYDVRPLTDHVTAKVATAVTYTLKVQYTVDNSSTSVTDLQAATAEYQKWQDETIGRAFNPDRLMAMLYQAGATRVVWGTGSEFDGGDVEYTEIEQTEYCSGTITLEVMST